MNVNKFEKWFYFIFLYFIVINYVVFTQNTSDKKVNFWEKLNKPKYVAAPMVDYSELAWRMLCRKHGADICFTQMLYSHLFANSSQYRDKELQLCPEDRPLVIQFCGHNPETLLKAALFAENKCDCIDLNLGCPQKYAKRFEFGAYLQDQWELLSKIVKTLSDNLRVPVSCKIRVFKDISKSVAYAQMLEDSGCQLLTVHGRTREQIKDEKKVASWSHIKAVKEAVKIPVISNGNIRCFDDVQRCLQETGCDAVMSAESLLCNPGIFENANHTVWDMATEYLDLTDKYECSPLRIRNHLIILFDRLLKNTENYNVRYKLMMAKAKNELRDVVQQIKERYEPIHKDHVWKSNQNFPPWICHAMVKDKTTNITGKFVKKKHNNSNRNETEVKNELKKLVESPTFYKCRNCSYTANLRCANGMCKKCCKIKCDIDGIGCNPHGFTARKFKSRIVGNWKKRYGRRRYL